MSNILGQLLKDVAAAVKPALKETAENFRENLIKNALNGRSVDELTYHEIHEAMLASCKLQRAIIKSGRFKASALGPNDVHEIERTIKLMLLTVQKSLHGHIYEKDIDDFLNRFYRTVEQTGND